MAEVIGYGVDYSARRLTGAALAAHRINGRPVEFVHRYLWFPGQQWPALNAAEVDDLTAHGIAIEAIYEERTSDPAGGWDAGVRMARQAVQSARDAGLPAGTTIYFCADAWLATHGIPVGTAMSFLDGARSGIAEFTVGAYGFRDFIFEAAAGGHADHFWLCGAEIPLAQVPYWLDAYQWNNGREYVDGLECDLIKRYRPIAGGGGGGGEEDDMFTDEDRTRDKGTNRALAEFETEYMARYGTEKTVGLALFELYEVISGFYVAAAKAGLPEEQRNLGTAMFQLWQNRNITPPVADVDEALLADELAKRGVGGTSAEDIKTIVEAVRGMFQRAGSTTQRGSEV